MERPRRNVVIPTIPTITTVSPTSPHKEPRRIIINFNERFRKHEETCCNVDSGGCYISGKQLEEELILGKRVPFSAASFSVIVFFFHKYHNINPLDFESTFNFMVVKEKRFHELTLDEFLSCFTSSQRSTMVVGIIVNSGVMTLTPSGMVSPPKLNEIAKHQPTYAPPFFKREMLKIIMEQEKKIAIGDVDFEDFAWWVVKTHPSAKSCVPILFRLVINSRKPLHQLTFIELDTAFSKGNLHYELRQHLMCIFSCGYISKPELHFVPAMKSTSQILEEASLGTLNNSDHISTIDDAFLGTNALPEPLTPFMMNEPETVNPEDLLDVLG